MQDLKLGKSNSLEVSAAPSAVVCAVLMVAVLSAVAYFLLNEMLFFAIVGGIVAAFLHYDSGLFHQMGHANAARTAGYPMTGMRYWWIFSQSLYPPDEPELPAETHVQRALGGPYFSLLMSLVSGFILYLTYTSNGPTGIVFYVFAFFFLDNLLFYTLGSFLPLGFTDGSTLLHWWPKLPRNK